MPTILEDNDWQTPQPDGPARRLRPFPHTTDIHVIEQDYVQNFADWLVTPPLLLNAAWADDPLFRLVKETDLQDFGNGVAKWTRIYAKVAATWIEMSTHSYNFIGFSGNFGLNFPGADGRERFTKTVRCQITRDYFMVGLGGTYTNERLIPINQATRYLVGSGTTTMPTDYLTKAAIYANPTSPTREAYEGTIASDVTNADQWSIVAETSTLIRWMGNIWCLETRRVKAE